VVVELVVGIAAGRMGGTGSTHVVSLAAGDDGRNAV
jgi:hypothetical protein